MDEQNTPVTPDPVEPQAPVDAPAPAEAEEPAEEAPEAETRAEDAAEPAEEAPEAPAEPVAVAPVSAPAPATDPSPVEEAAASTDPRIDGSNIGQTTNSDVVDNLPKNDSGQTEIDENGQIVGLPADQQPTQPAA